MPEFEPLTSDDRRLIGASEPPAIPSGRRRWRSWWRVGGVVLLLAGLATVAVRGSESPPVPRPGAVPSRAPAQTAPLPVVGSPVILERGTAPLDLDGELASFDVAPDGYALVGTSCVTSDRCRAGVAVSPDGVRWSARKLPADVAADVLTVWSLGGGVLVVEEPGRLRLRSGDGGRTWSRVSTAPAAAVPDATPGVLTLAPTGGLRHAPCAGTRLAVVRHDTGRTAPLRHQPLGMHPCAVMVKGRWLWVAGIDPVSRQPVVALSGDRGAGWATLPVPDLGGEAERVWLSVAGSELYLTVFGPLPESPVRFGVVAVYLHTRHGWVRTVRYTGPSEEISGMIACPDGMLLAVLHPLAPYQRARQLVSYDRGRSWSLAEGTALVISSTPSSPRGDGARYGWAYTSLGREGLVRSTDCRTWHQLPVR
ncbi:MAG: hypothetical protein ACRDT6_05575 [Micromonosporaceae bacterium]